MPFASHPTVLRSSHPSRRPAAAVKLPERSAWPVRTPIRPEAVAARQARTELQPQPRLQTRVPAPNVQTQTAAARQTNRAAAAQLRRLRTIESIGAGATIVALLVIAMFG